MKTKGRTGNENIDRIIASSKFAKLRQQLLRSSDFHDSGKTAVSGSESSQHHCANNYNRLDRKSSHPSNLASEDDYNSSIAAEFLPTNGLPFTLRSSSLGFSQKNKISVDNNCAGLNVHGRSSLSVPFSESKSTKSHRVRFVTEATSEDNIVSRKGNVCSS